MKVDFHKIIISFNLGIRYCSLILVMLLGEVANGQPCNLIVNAGNDVSVCIGSSITLTAISTDAVNPGAVTYKWDSNPGLSNENIANPVANPSSATTYKVTATEGTCTATDEVVVTVNPLPVIDFTFTNDNACSGTVVQFTSSVSLGTAPFSYKWNFGDSSTSTDKNPSHVFSSLGCGNGTFTVELTVKDKNGCESIIKKTIFVKQQPDVNFEDVNASGPVNQFSNCQNASASNPNYMITVGNTSVSSCATFSVNWGDGNSESNITFPKSHTYSQLGAYNMAITALGTNGCSTSKTYVIKNVSNPSGGINSPGSTQNLCIPTAAILFTISNWDTNSPGTTYSIDYGDNSPLLNLTQSQLESSPYYHTPLDGTSANYPIPYSYTTNSCPNAQFTATLTVTNACGITKGTISNITTISKPTADFTASQYACKGSNVLFTNKSNLGFDTNCSRQTKYKWDFGDLTPTQTTGWTTNTDNISHVFSTPGNYTVTLTSLNSCGETTKTQQICIESGVTPIFSLNNIQYCLPLIVTAINTTNITDVCTSVSYFWQVTYSSSNCGTSPAYTFTNGTNATSKDPSFQFTNSGTYAIKLLATNGCGTFTSPAQIVTVMQPPTVSIANISAICQSLPSTIINPSATVNSCTPVLNTLSYAWSFPGGNPASSVDENPGPVTYDSPGDYLVTLTVTNECGPTTATKLFTIKTVPILTNPPLDQTICAGTQVALVNLTSNTPGTFFSWTVSASPGITGYAIAGSGSAIPASTINSTNATQETVTYNITPSIGGCSGNVTTYTIKVNPKPVVTYTPNSQTICSGQQTALVTLNSNVSGADIEWTVNPVPIAVVGFTANGTSTIPVQTITNSGTTPKTISYHIVPSLNVGLSCPGTPVDYNITVKPLPVIIATPASQSICSETITTPIRLESNLSGTTYSWTTTSSPGITGAPSSGSANPIPSWKLFNAEPLTGTVTITVTPTSNGCEGIPYIYKIEVSSKLIVNSPINQTICSGGQSAQVDLTANITGANFTWTASSTPGTTGSNAIGTDIIESKTLLNSTFVDGVITYVITPKLVGCNGSPLNYTVTVRPVANVSNSPMIKTICLGSNTAVILTSNVSGTSFDWSASNTIGTVSGFSLTGSGNINDVLTNTGTIAGKVSYTITPKANGCVGLPVNYDITVQPVAHATPNPLSQLICSGTKSSDVNLASDVSGTIFRWTANASPGITGFTPSGNGNIIAGSLIKNTLSTPGKVTYSIIPSIGGCDGVIATHIITVNPSPRVINSLAQTICSGNSTTLVTLGSDVPGTTFSWNVSPVPSSNIVGNLQNGIGNIASHQISNNGAIAEHVIYHIIPTSDMGLSCNGIEADYTVTVNPLPVAQAIPATSVICSGEFTSIRLTSNLNNITYSWTIESASIAVEGATDGSGSVISQKLINSSAESGNVKYKVIPKVGICEGVAFYAEITVNPRPSPDIIGNSSNCLGNEVYRTEANMSNYVWSVSSGGIINTGQGTFKISVKWENPGNQTVSINYKNSFSCNAAPPAVKDVKVNPDLPVRVTITPDMNNVCPGTEVTYRATPDNGGLNPVYEWKVNGIVASTNGSSYTYAPINGDKIDCQLTSNAICPVENPAKSNVVSMVVYSNLPATVSIIENINNVCPGDNVSFFATPSNEGSNPNYQWFVNSTKVGSNLPVFNYNPVNNDVVTCLLISSNICSVSGTVLSNPISLSVALPPIEPMFEILKNNDCAPINVVLKNISPSTGTAYIWDFGDGETLTTATAVDVPHTFQNFSGATKVFNISLRIISGSTHCFNLLKKTITVIPEAIFGTPVSYIGCSPFIRKFENAYAGAKSYRWVDSNHKVLSTAFQPTLAFEAQLGRDSTHVVYLIAEAFTGCLDTIINTIKVSPGLEMPSFTYSGKTDCRSVTYTFNNTSSEGADLFVWDLDDGTINKTYHANEKVVHTFLNGMDVPIPFNITLTSSNGTHCSLSTTQKIMVDPGYLAGFPVTFQGCSPMTRTFVNAYKGSKFYQWKSSDWKLLSNEMSPTFTFKALLGRDSTYLVYLIAESLNGCIDTVVNKVIVRAANKAEFSAIPTVGCAPLLVQFSNASSSKTNSYQWDFADGSDCSIVENPRHIFIDPNGLDVKYNVSLIAFNQFGCADTAFHEIHLLPTPQVDFIAQPIIQVYPERTVKLTNLTPLGNWTYTWNLGDQKPVIKGQLSEYTYDSSGEYVISLSAKGVQCENTKRVKVTIDPGIPLAAFDPDTAGCPPLKVTFRNYSKNSSRFQWDFGNGTQSVDFSPSITYYDEGTHTVKLNAFNQFGVMSEIEKKIIIHSVPKALFKPLPYRVKIPGQTVTFFNDSENAKDYLWDFGDGGSSFDAQPVHQYTQTGKFNVTLYITSAEGCKDTFLIPEAVDAFSDGLKVPNAFMPNKEGPADGYYESGDPRNHIFYPAIAVGDLIEYEMMIYNRWGNLLFVTKEAERGWDGYYNGTLCPQDVYIWKIRCKFKSGSIVTKTGDVTLIQ
ncbi:MAG: PKD domain-containing protein [Mariniphaga sp.]|nr:PKD domain-containing protein [Mariniphaga sp.]